MWQPRGIPGFTNVLAGPISLARSFRNIISKVPESSFGRGRSAKPEGS